jgi:hypothetical protein
MSKQPKNTPNPTPYASDEELAALEEKRLHSGAGAFDRFKNVAETVLSVPKDDFDEQWAATQKERKRKQETSEDENSKAPV